MDVVKTPKRKWGETTGERNPQKFSNKRALESLKTPKSPQKLSKKGDPF